MTIQTLLPTIWDDLHETRVLWQLAILVLSVAAGWGSRELLPAGAAAGRWRVGAAGFRRVRAPLVALALTMIGRGVLRHYSSVSLLDLALPLLAALAISRTIVYMVRLSFSGSAWLSASERLIAWLIWLALALHITGLAPELLDYIDDIKLPIGKQHLSLLTLLQGMLVLALALLAALWLGKVTEQRLVQARILNTTLRVMLTNVMRPVLVLIALLIALPAVGIDLTALSVFGGALGVGLGLGLQKIASNYVSGIVILLDRAVSIGSQITVDTHTGQITAMTARYAVLRKSDGTEAIIPNDTLITSTVINHSFSDSRVRMVIPVTIAYGADVAAAMRIMTEVAQAHAGVSDAPPPSVLITTFGENGLRLELGFWLDVFTARKEQMVSDIHLDLWQRFGAQGIEIPAQRRQVQTMAETARTAPPTAC